MLPVLLSVVLPVVLWVPLGVAIMSIMAMMATAQMGMTPEQVVSKIMSDPQLAAAFQNPRIQAAILDVSAMRCSTSKP